MKSAALRILISLLLPCCAMAKGFRTELGESANDLDLRLRLSDHVQESRTTSLNWYDLGEAALPLASARLEAARTVRVALAKKWRILLDVGHGGKDEGAQGFYGISEKFLSLKIGILVKEALERFQKVQHLPFEVKLSRQDDIFLTLRDRVRLANEWPADLFVSIHGNSSSYPKARGFEVYFLSSEASDEEAGKVVSIENNERLTIKPDVLSMLSDAQMTYHVAESSQFAETIFQSMSNQLHANARGVRQGPFAVLAGTTMPAVLIEVGYVTHPQEAIQLLTPDYLKRLANAISTGIMEFASQTKKVS